MPPPHMAQASLSTRATPVETVSSPYPVCSTGTRACLRISAINKISGQLSDAVRSCRTI